MEPCETPFPVSSINRTRRADYAGRRVGNAALVRHAIVVERPPSQLEFNGRHPAAIVFNPKMRRGIVARPSNLDTCRVRIPCVRHKLNKGHGRVRHDCAGVAAQKSLLEERTLPDHCNMPFELAVKLSE